MKRKIDEKYVDKLLNLLQFNKKTKQPPADFTANVMNRILVDKAGVVSIENKELSLYYKFLAASSMVAAAAVFMVYSNINGIIVSYVDYGFDLSQLGLF